MNNKTPLVSVLVSTYNNSETIEASINSVLSQTYDNTEILIIDDGSEDDTYIKLKNFKNNKLKLFKNKENIGLTKSLNLLVNKATGHYIARHDADDISLPDRFSFQINSMQSKNYEVSTTRAMNLTSNIKLPGKSFYLPKKLVMKIKNPFIHGTLMIKKSTFEKIGYYDERFYYAQDYKLFSDLLKNKIEILNLNKVLYLLNMNNNISTNFKKEQNYFANCVRKNINP